MECSSAGESGVGSVSPYFSWSESIKVQKRDASSSARNSLVSRRRGVSFQFDSRLTVTNFRCPEVDGDLELVRETHDNDRRMIVRLEQKTPVPVMIRYHQDDPLDAVMSWLPLWMS
jgi:hypothetical protein